MTRQVALGQIVQLNRDVDVFPTILCSAGHIGIVASSDSERIMVRMYNHFPELEEWGNELEIWREWHEDALTVLSPA
jgi:hypothetical protein